MKIPNIDEPPVLFSWLLSGDLNVDIAWSRISCNNLLLFAPNKANFVYSGFNHVVHVFG